VEALLELRERDDLNVVFLLVDTLRAHRLGLYGYDRDTTPNLDAVAASGIVFDDVVSQSSWTKTSMASLWTATHPVRNGMLRFDHVLPEEAVMPAERFRDAGYRTAGIFRNGWVDESFGFAQGFDTYVRPVIGRERIQMHRDARTVGPIAGSDEDLTIAATAFLDQFGGERFFLYLHYMDVHQYVYDEASAIFGTSYSDVYDQAVRWTDRLIGGLLQRLEDDGILDRTLVVIASDHGEAFLEHGFEGHARNLYDEVAHVPLILLPPVRLDPGVRVTATISNADVWPTILDLVGLPPLPGADGRSMLPLILEAGGAAANASSEGLVRPVFAQIARDWGRPKREGAPSLVAVTSDGKRFVAALSGQTPPELYDHADDPTEQRDLAEARPDTASAMQARIDAYAADAEPPWGRAPHRVELDELRLNHLRALGYVIEP
jgi:arylsulfatase A-like enzyme